MTKTKDTERYRAQVAALQGALDGGDAAAFRAAFDVLAQQMHLELMPELKRVTGRAQSALARFRAEARLDALAGHDMPDARKRLMHVVDLTDQAAHRTLDLVEKSGPIVEEATRGSAQLLELWGAYANRDVAGASMWPERAHDYLERTRADSESLRTYLSELLMVQGYQDITGQIIRSVIGLVDEIEKVLGQLIEIAHGNENSVIVRALPVPENWERGLGPQVEGVSTGDAFTAQGDIDALLSQMAGGK